MALTNGLHDLVDTNLPDNQSRSITLLMFGLCVMRSLTNYLLELRITRLMLFCRHLCAANCSNCIYLADDPH